MSDRFRFRVWDKGNEQYLNLSEVDYLTLNTENGGLIIGFLDELTTELTYMPEKDMVVEQCTGLKDKNGNLIYEGDIIKDRFRRKFKVVWNQEDVVFEGRIIVYDPEYSDRYDFYEGATDDVEIIGNIHEQAEQKE